MERIKLTVVWVLLLSTGCIGVVSAAVKAYNLSASGITRTHLENYLQRSVTMAEFLTTDPFCNDGSYPDKARDVELIRHIGAKFIGRAIYRWGDEKAFNNPEFLGNAKKLASTVHQHDPDVIFQAALFEAVSSDVNSIAIPAWVFQEFDRPVENRNFSYEKMLNTDGKFVAFWDAKTSVPDIVQDETKLWFLFLAGSYINIGCEALHLGQVALIGMKDVEYTHWKALLDIIRNYAAKHARRNWVLLDAHTPFGGMKKEGRSLLDFNSFPLRIKEVPGKPFQCVLEKGYLDSFYGRSEGGITPTGWQCESLPYLVEFDNFGISDTPGQLTISSHYVWGYDEISWFCLQDEEYRKKWLSYAYRWLKETDSNGFLQMPVTRINVVDKNQPAKRCRANTRTSDFPQGMNLEETIRELWKRQD